MRCIFVITSLVIILILFSNGNCMLSEMNEIFKKIELEFKGFLKSYFEPVDNSLPNNFKFSAVSKDPVDLPTPELIIREGYKAETHSIQTEDGYELAMHRIPNKRNSEVIFLQHGLLGSSADWVMTGKEKGLAFLLSDQGYDVWMGNARGNTYSRKHNKYSINDSRFWQFSFHEMGMYDLPAEINYVSNVTNISEFIYIGHSMGTTMFYVMVSERPELNQKFKMMFSLAPIAFMSHMKSPLRLITPFIREINFIMHYLGKGEFLPQSAIIKFLAKYGCDLCIDVEKICTNVLFTMVGFDSSQFNMTLLPVIMSHTPAGASTNTFIHYAQEIESGKFRQFDYGRRNIDIYNSTEPPEYNISKISVPVVLFWSDNDWLASPLDVKRFSKLLPHLAANYRVNYTKFNHIDFLWGIDVRPLVYDKLLYILDHMKINIS